MNPNNRLRPWLIGLALGVLLTLLIAPATRWLVRAQFAASGLTVLTPAAQQRQAEDAQRALVARRPDDFPLQLASAVNGFQTMNDFPQDVSRLRALVPRFGNNPALYATLLRFEIGNSSTGTGVYLSRAEDWALGGVPPPADYHEPPPPDPRLLAAYDADAAAGERLDPDNAFFPQMRAVSLFAAHRDADGLDAVLRAGQKPHWDDYVADEMNGRLELADAPYGHGSALSDIAANAAVLLPHYAALRAVARVAIAKAIAAEAAGQTERGLAIRLAMMHSGGLMRAQSTMLLGALVGIAIAAIATARPGGAPAPPYDSHLTGEQQRQRRLQAFYAYARRIGHPEAAQQAQAEAAANDAEHAIFRKAEDKFILNPPQLDRLGVWWLAGLLTLANAAWLLVFGAIAAGLSRLPSVANTKPLPRPAQDGIFAALVVVLVGTLLRTNGLQGILPLTPLILILVPWLVVWLMRGTRENWPERRQALAQFFRALPLGALALLALGAPLLILGALAAWQIQGVLGFVQTLHDLTGVSGNGAAGDMPQAAEAEVLTLIGSLTVPLLMLLVLSIVGRVRRVPVSVALVYGYRTKAVPAACLLVVLYGALALGTLRQERQMEDALHQIVQNECLYYASLAGQPWPGPPPR